jgi:tetratricopeptide (TPR) repeat protein
MSRTLALGGFVVLVAASAATGQDFADKTVKIRADVRLGTKQAGGLLRDGEQLRQGEAFTVKADDGIYIELVGQKGFLFKNEVELFVGREMPKPGAPAAKVDAKDLWPEGDKAMLKRTNSQIQFGDRAADGRITFYAIAGTSVTVRRDNGDGWVRVHDSRKEGWVGKDDLVLLKDAVAHFDKAVQANPRDSWSLFMRAAANHMLNKHDAAIEDYTAYLKIVPNGRSGLNNRGNVWVSKKEYDKAIDDYSEALKGDPKFAMGYANRARAWYLKKDYDRAVADCDTALELDPKYSLALTYKGQALAKQKKYAEAAKVYEAAVKLEPLAGRYNSLAWFLATCPDEKFRDGKKALELAKKAVEQSGKVVPWAYRSTLAAAFAETGDFEKAVAEMQKALEDKEVTKDDRKKLEERLELYKTKKPYRDEE